LVEHPPPNLVGRVLPNLVGRVLPNLVGRVLPNLEGSVRLPVGLYRSCEKQCLPPVQPRALRWWMGARKRFTRGAAIGSPPVQHSLRKQPVVHGASKRKWVPQTTRGAPKVV